MFTSDRRRLAAGVEQVLALDDLGAVERDEVVVVLQVGDGPVHHVGPGL
jgi:hypothetical protein